MSDVGKMVVYNGKTYIINSCDEKSGRCQMTETIGPMVLTRPQNLPIISAEHKDLNFFREQTFTNTLPSAKLIHLSRFKGKYIPDGVILDVSDGNGIPRHLLENQKGLENQNVLSRSWEALQC